MGTITPGHADQNSPSLKCANSYWEEGSAVNFLSYQPVAKVCWLLSLLEYQFGRLE